MSRLTRRARLELLTIQIVVTVMLMFCKKVEIEEERTDSDILYELDVWAKEKGLKLSIQDKEKPIIVKGHHYVYQFSGTKRYNVLIFSK